MMSIVEPCSTHSRAPPSESLGDRCPWVFDAHAVRDRELEYLACPRLAVAPLPHPLDHFAFYWLIRLVVALGSTCILEDALC